MLNQQVNTLNYKFTHATENNIKYHTITYQNPFKSYSLEEIHLMDLMAGYNPSQPAPMNNNSNGGLFGNTAAAPAAGGGLFGNTAAPAAGGGLFGNTAAPATGGGGLFGNTAAAPAAGGGLFGNTAAPAAGGGLFGNTAAPATGGGLFGNTAAAPAAGGGLFGNTAAPAAGGGLFGNTTAPAAGGGLFGNTAAAPAAGGGLFGNTAAPATGGGLFGNTAAPAAGGGLFGNTAAPAAGGGLFGNTAAAPATGGGLFGNAAAPATSGGLFGNTAAPPAGGGLFGNTAAPATGGGLFGNTAAPAAGGGLFGNTAAPATGGGLFGNTTAPATSGGLFGNTAAPATGGGLFGNAAAPTTGGGLFGNTAAPAAGGGLFGSSTTGGGLFGSSTTTGGGLFGNTAAPAVGGAMPSNAVPREYDIVTTPINIPTLSTQTSAALATLQTESNPTPSSQNTDTQQKNESVPILDMKSTFVFRKPRGVARKNVPSSSQNPLTPYISRDNSTKSMSAIVSSKSPSPVGFTENIIDRHEASPVVNDMPHIDQYIFESFIHSSSVKVPEGVSTVPSTSELSTMKSEELKRVEGFKIFREGMGSVTFKDPVDINGLDLGNYFDFPAEGVVKIKKVPKGLDVRCTIVIQNCCKEHLSENEVEKMKNRSIVLGKRIKATNENFFDPQKRTLTFEVDNLNNMA